MILHSHNRFPSTCQVQTHLLCLAFKAFHNLLFKPRPEHSQHTPFATAVRPDLSETLVGRTAFLPFFLPTCSSGSGAKSTSSKKLSPLFLPLNALSLTVHPLLYAGSTPPTNMEVRPLKTRTSSPLSPCIYCISTEIQGVQKSTIKS